MHNLTLTRLLDDDMSVALFSIEQVWEGRVGGKGNYLVKNDSIALQSYLPTGSHVNVLVRLVHFNIK